MPEIKNTFQAGKMNKDLDERLIRNVEYRDALNIDIASSESSDAGAAENSYGNIQKSFQGQAGNKCVGSLAYGSLDKIIWLIAGTTAGSIKKDLILEYNTVTKVVNNIITDVYQTTAVTASTVSTGTTLTLASANANLRVGMVVSGTNIVVGTKITNVNGITITVDTAFSSDVAANYTVTFVADRVLNFKTNNIITGINVVEDILFFTDNITEPKRIPIKRLASGTPDNATHTKFKVDGVDKGFLEEKHITVIRKYPLNAPSIVMDNSEDGGVISSYHSSLGSAFTYMDAISGDVVALPPGTSCDAAAEINGVTVLDFTAGGAGTPARLSPTAGLQFTPKPGWVAGQTIKLTAEAVDNGLEEDIEVRLKLNSLTTEDSTSKTFKCTILSISDTTPSAALSWTAILEQKDPFYELVFPRFAYRWKYVDGEYSVFSPFSKVAFLPEKEIGFDYDPKNAYNLAMTNNIRKLTISGFETIPPDVVEVDILYKESNNTNIYTVETLKQDTLYDSSFSITSEQVHSLIPSNQLLRPYDNVPRTAKAQEISGNRLIYGNYVQQFNIPSDPKFVLTHTASQANYGTRIPEESLKSIRNYQVGIIFLDKYGRQTPVLSNDSASEMIHQVDGSKVNSLSARVTTPAPPWATHYKYYIKEPSAEYYNLAMDRYYPAEDGNMWLSFPSSERNKVAVDDHIILKKKHSSDDPVSTDDNAGTVKYKILAIENSAPDFLKEQKTSIGTISTQFGTSTSNVTGGFPEKDFLTFKIPGPDIANSALGDIAAESLGSAWFKIGSDSMSSEYYKPSEVTRVDANSDGDYSEDGSYYRIKMEKPFGDDILFVGIGTAKTQGLTFTWYKEELDLYKAEYSGRFFIKLNRDSVLEEFIVSANTNIKYAILNQERIYWVQGLRNDSDDWKNKQIYAIDSAESYDRQYEPTSHDYGIGMARTGYHFDIRLSEIGPEEKPEAWFYPPREQFTANYDLNNQLNNVGTFFRWKDDPAQTVYKIVQTQKEHLHNWSGGSSKKKWSSNHGIRYKIKVDKPISWTPLAGGFQGVTPSNTASLQYGGGNTYPLTRFGEGGSRRNSFTEIQILKEVDDEITFASSNPAIWETEPKERIDLNLYYETSKTHPIAELGNDQKIDWFNCYSFGNGVESNRIRDDFNAVVIDKGPRVSTELAAQYKKENKKTGMIFSGIFNSSSGVNRLNEFIQAEAITKDLNPSYGSIQKIFARDTNIIVFCEDKTLKVLVDKDALYSASGSAQLTATNKTLGQTIPFQGDYGISTNPESFATFGFRIYYADKNRNAILRLSGDGIEELTRYGMTDYFKDAYAAGGEGLTSIIGSYDDDKGNYNITLNYPHITSETISFTEKVKGWTSRKSFIQEDGLSLNGKYYTFYNGEIWEHNANALRNNFYGVTTNYSSIKFIFNEGPSVVKNFKTLNYEGSDSAKYETVIGDENDILTKGWYNNSIETDQQSGHVTDFVNKEGKHFNYIKGLATTWNNTTLTGNLDIQEFSSQGVGNITNIVDSASQTKHNIIYSINITNLAANHASLLLAGLVDEAGDPTYTTSSTDGPYVNGLGVITKTATSSVSQDIVITITPAVGYVLDAASFANASTNETSSPITNAVNGNILFANTGTANTYANKVTVTMPISFTMPAQDQTIVGNITGSAISKRYSVSGTSSDVITNEDGSSNTVSGSGATYSVVGGFGQTVTLFTRVYTVGANSIFPALISKDMNGCKTPSNYTIKATETTGGVAGGNLTVCTIQVDYTFPEEDVEEDHINFVGKTIPYYAPSTSKIYSYKISQETIPYSGVTKTLYIWGDKDATVDINVFDQAATSVSLLGSAYNSTRKVITIPEKGLHKETIIFDTILADGAALKTYSVEMQEKAGSVGVFQGPMGGTGTPKLTTVSIIQRAKMSVVYGLAANSPQPVGYTVPATKNVSYITGRDPREDSDYTNPQFTFDILATSTASNWKLIRQPLNTDFGSSANAVANTNNGLVQGALGTIINPDVTLTVDNSLTNAKASFTGEFSTRLVGTPGNTGSQVETLALLLNNILVINLIPVAATQSLSIGYNTATAVDCDATDADNDTLTYSIVTAPSHGSLNTMNSTNGIVTYTPTSNYSGSDSFSFKANDGLNDSNTAVITLTVQGSGGTPTYSVGYQEKDSEVSGDAYALFSPTGTPTVTPSGYTVGSTSNVTFQITGLNLGPIHGDLPSYVDHLGDLSSLLNATLTNNTTSKYSISGNPIITAGTINNGGSASVTATGLTISCTVSNSGTIANGDIINLAIRFNYDNITQ